MGFDVEGLATTKPAPAPGTSEPSGPILLSAPWRAMARSAVMKESRSLACNCDGMARAAENNSEDIAREERARIMRTVVDDACESET